jgi:hypothetical protein
MMIDVLIEYDKKLSEVTFSSNAAQFTERRTARIGLSRPKHKDISAEQIEFVGESWEIIKKIEDWFPNEPTRKDQILRIINPFESATFEPLPAFRMIQHLIWLVRQKIYPKTYILREHIPFLDKNEITLKIPGYNLFNSQKKAEFEKLLLARYKYTTFVS